MKRFAFLRILSVLLACTMLSAALTGCGKKMEETADGVRMSDDSLFHHASTVYQPVEMGRKYGKLTVAEGMTLEVYTIEGLSADEWLSTEDGDVLYADGVSLPSLTEMAPTAMQVYYQTSSHILRRVTSADIVASFTDAYENGTAVSYPNTPAVRSLRVCFESETYPSLYFVLIYLEYGEDVIIGGENCGRYFLYNRFDSRCVPVNSGLHDVLGLTDSETDTAEAE